MNEQLDTGHDPGADGGTPPSAMFSRGGLGAAALMHSIAGLADLHARQVDHDRLLAAEGAGHIVHDLPLRADGRMVALESRPWRLDPIPLVIDGDEFVALADGAIARMRMLEAIVDDLYGARTLLRDAVVDSSALWGSPRYRLAAFGQRPQRRWLTNYAVDVVRDVDGRWRVVRDLTDAPAGVGYAMLGRAVAGRVHRDQISRLPAGEALRSLDPFADRLRDGLADVALNRNPRIVVLSGGVDHPSFVEQSYLATRLGLNLAEGADLVVRQRRVWLRSLSGLEPIDVIFRRLEDDRVDPMEVNAEGRAGVPGLLLAARSGGVSLANAHGTGVLEDPVLGEQWDAAGAWLTGRTSDYQGVWPLPFMPAAERSERQWSLWPSYDGSGLVDRAITLRLHLVASDKGIDVLQGGSARVLLSGDDPIRPTAATAKDVWVIGGTVAPPALRRREPLPQVDLIASVPTRAAEALFWAGRAMERAEILARCDGSRARPHERPRRCRGCRTVGGVRPGDAGGRRRGAGADRGRRPGWGDVRFGRRGIGPPAGCVPCGSVIGPRILLDHGRPHAGAPCRVAGATALDGDRGRVATTVGGRHRPYRRAGARVDSHRPRLARRPVERERCARPRVAIRRSRTPARARVRRDRRRPRGLRPVSERDVLRHVVDHRRRGTTASTSSVSVWSN